MAAVQSAALVSDEKRIRGVYTRRCTIQIDNIFNFTALIYCEFVNVKCSTATSNTRFIALLKLDVTNFERI